MIPKKEDTQISGIEWINQIELCTITATLYLNKDATIHAGENITSSTNSDGKTVYPYVEKARALSLTLNKSALQMNQRLQPKT